MSILAAIKFRTVSLWVIHVIPFLSSPKVMLGTTWTIWLMRKEIGMITAWTSLIGSYVTSHTKVRKERVTCKMCDRLMSDIMEAAEDVVDIPCSVMCLRWKPCIDMCDKLKTISQDSDSYPCIEGGYCPEDGWFDDELADFGYNVPDCHFERHGINLLECEPNTHCHRIFKGLRFQCKMKPGAAKWVGMQRSMATSAGVLTHAMSKWPRCSEDNGANTNFCIAEPSGTGYIAFVITNVIIFIIGGYKSIRAAITPGGDDDREMLILWIIITFFLNIEGYFRVLMSRWFPPYYEIKLIFVIWLMFFSGTTIIFRTILQYWEDIHDLLGIRDDPDQKEIKELDRNNFLAAIDGDYTAGIDLPINFATWYNNECENNKKNNHNDNMIPRRDGCFSPYYKKDKRKRRSSLSESCRLRLSAMSYSNPLRTYYTGWSRSSEDLIYLYHYIHDNRDMLSKHYGQYHWWHSVTEATASCVSFHPKFLKISLRSACNIPSMDGEHKDSDVYAVIMIECPTGDFIDHNGNKLSYKRSSSFENLSKLVGYSLAKTIKYGKVRSTTKFDTSTPIWNEDFEIQLDGGSISSSGLYQNYAVRNSVLVINIRDEDYWQVSMFFQIASTMIIVFLPILFFISIFEYPYFTTKQRLEEILNGNDFLLQLMDLGMILHSVVSSKFRMSDGRPATMPFMILFFVIFLFQSLRIMWNQSTEKDDLIGTIKIPLNNLLDQQEHYYHHEPLKMYNEDSETYERDSNVIVKKENNTAATNGNDTTTATVNYTTSMSSHQNGYVKNEKNGVATIDFAVRLLEA